MNLGYLGNMLRNMEARETSLLGEIARLQKALAETERLWREERSRNRAEEEEERTG